MAGPEVGSVHDGYRFNGGSPSDQANWTQVSPVDVSSEYGAGARRLPNGTIERVGPRGGVTKISGAASGGGTEEAPLVGADARARFMLGLGPLTDAQNNLTELEKSGNPLNRDWGANLIDQITEVPFLRNIGDSAARAIGGEDYQKYQQAAATYEASLLPIQSGAAVTPSEASRQIRADLPAWGDSPEVIARKARNRSMRINAIAKGIGQDEPFDTTGGVGQIGPNGIPTYPGIAAQVANISGGWDGQPIAPEEIDPTSGGPGSSQASAIDFTNPENRGALADLIATGGWLREGDGAPYYVEPGGIRQGGPGQNAEAAAPGVFVERQDWTPEGAVEQRRNMNPILRNIDAAGRGFADAATLEWSDEIAAGADAALGQGRGQNFNERYRSNVAVQRAIDEADQEDVLPARRLGQGAAFTATAVGLGGRALARGTQRFASPVLNRAATGVRNALAGVGIGGVAAAGEQEGDALTRGQAALRAAPMNAVFGVAAPLAVNAAAPRVAAALQPANQFVQRQLGRAGQALGVPNSAAMVERATPNALEAAVDRFGQRMGPRRIEQVAERVGTARGLGVNANLVTGLDDASVGRVRALASRDTQARDLAVRSGEDASRRLPSRVRAIAEEEISPDARPTLDVIDDLANQRRNNAASIQGFGNDPVDLSENVVAAMQGSTTRGALRAAADRAGSSLDEAERAAEPMLRALADSGPASARLSVREVQDISAALRKAADSAYRNGNPEGPILSQLGNAIRQAGRDQSEGYGQWLGRYADDSSLLESATLGRNFVSSSADPIAERSTDAFVRGATSATDPERQVQRAASRRALEAASSSGRRARSTLEAAASDEDFYRRADALGVDATRLSARARAELDNVRAQERASPRIGSETSTNAQDAAGAAGITPGAVIDTLRRPISAALNTATRRFVSRGFSDAEAEALVEAAINPARTDELVSMLQRRMSRREARTLARAVQRSLSANSGAQSAQQ